MGWKRNLVILCIGQFLAVAAMSSISPFLSLYIQELGVTNEKEAGLWTGLIFGSNFFTAFIFSPIWGKIADKHGRKMMVIRSGIGMAITITLMGFVSNHIQLLILRMINGCISGFIPASIALMSTLAPKKKVGYALGILNAAAVSGSIGGPLIGGVMADHLGYGAIFSYTGILLFIAAVLVIFFVHEDFVKNEKEEKSSIFDDFKKITANKPISSLFISVTFVQLATLGTIPLISVFVQELSPAASNIAFLSGLAASVMGFSNMLASPRLGKLGDKIGSENVLLYSVIAAALFMIPQAFVMNLWQLIIFRFLFGLCIGGMLPSINTLLRHFAPEGMESRTYSYSTSAMYLGNIIGPNIAGLFTAGFGIRSIFIWSGVLLLVNAAWIKKIIMPNISYSSKYSEARHNVSK
ncbi:MFS transporter [Robertmurraya massiliosenegalensis]|uniref:MFS transporter n=1 Tax=Robertmurraya TaxID=2837507 RepID=UPI0039A73476